MRPCVAALTLLLCVPLAVASDEESGTTAMPMSVSDTPFSTERDAVVWRREELKDIESLVRQLRFDLVNNENAEEAAPRLAELQQRASGEHLLPAFIAGTHGAGSEARPAIWEEWDDFSAGFAELERHVDQLVIVAGEEDYRGAAQALSAVAASCKSCHRAYRFQ